MIQLEVTQVDSLQANEKTADAESPKVQRIRSMGSADSSRDTPGMPLDERAMYRADGTGGVVRRLRVRVKRKRLGQVRVSELTMAKRESPMTDGPGESQRYPRRRTESAT